MPRKKSGLFDNKSYQNEYHKAMKTKLISFNPANQDDMKLWDHLQTKENQTKYIKELMRKDMIREEHPCDICKHNNECAEIGCPLMIFSHEKLECHQYNCFLNHDGMCPLVAYDECGSRKTADNE